MFERAELPFGVRVRPCRIFSDGTGDCDGAFRFYTQAAACLDSDRWLPGDECRPLMEAAASLYGAAAYFKHRAEGEPCDMFAYAGHDLRVPAYRTSREFLRFFSDANTAPSTITVSSPNGSEPYIDSPLVALS